MQERAILDKVIFEFVQEGNTDGTTSETEELNVEIQSCIGCITKEGGYYVLRSPTGWSINDSSELNEIITFVERVLENGIKKA